MGGSAGYATLSMPRNPVYLEDDQKDSDMASLCRIFVLRPDKSTNISLAHLFAFTHFWELFDATRLSAWTDPALEHTIFNPGANLLSAQILEPRA
jgi:hypothetical protein